MELIKAFAQGTVPRRPVCACGGRKENGEMGKKLFSKQSPKCANCLHGSCADGEDAVFCRKRGVLRPTDSCRHFVYDPLARKPKTLQPLPTFKAEDFSLE
ncbi:MAG: hypothetical protein J6B12_00920 [Clostridia bacterium]|nr:hypothetical protein [Clostridia bacterium]